ncbi:UNVERIFIED_CONTAM: hypothetical protein Sradi_5840800 [Sesamum radiatum]|uniref:Uncharacterized protein n=1 Tax=Sesamum radiatum TaxID=300843 RepID=A0AAW2KPK4_SESRA
MHQSFTASVNSQDVSSMSDWTSGSSTFENVKNNVVQIDRPDANPNFCSNLSTDNISEHGNNGYSTETDGRLCLKRHLYLDKSVHSGAETTGGDSLNSGSDSGAPTMSLLSNIRETCTRVVGCGSYATVRGVNRIVPSVTCNYDSEFISRRQSSFHQGITAQSVQCGAATSEDEKTISSELMDFPDVVNSQETVDEHDKHWMSEEELETHAVGGMDYNDSSWAWREADMNRAVDDMVAFSSSYSTNGLTSPSAASFCSPFDTLAQGPLGYVMPGSEISSKVLHSSSTMTDVGAEESVSGSMPNIWVMEK